MSRGLPVITTTHSGGADLIDEKVDGLVIPAESKASITGAISWCVENKNLLPLMGEKARTKAAAYPWSSYRKRLVSEIVQRKAVWVHSKKSA
ncbi:MAG: glycosyltransferase, partial [Chitinophagaceae bacterium]